MSSLKILDWDSLFFNKRIGKITWNESGINTQLIKLLRDAKKEKYDLIYLFCNTKINNSILLNFNGKLVDTKVVYQKFLTKEHPVNSSIESYSDKKISPQLNELAHLSGAYSRFKTDDNFRPEDFINLYNEWLKKSVSREIADEVFIYTEDREIIGFVTVAIEDNIGHIGLIAVNPNYKGKNIGTLLLNKVDNFLNSKKINELHVPTQKENSTACNFYKKNNFNILTTKNIYHFNIFHKMK